MVLMIKITRHGADAAVIQVYQNKWIKIKKYLKHSRNILLL